MKKATKMVEEITRKRKMTQEVKDKLNQEIWLNLCLAIGVMLYFCAMDAIYLYSASESSEMAFKIMAMIAILLTVIVFEVAYRKESGRLGIVGIELLGFSVIGLYMPHIYAHSYQVIGRVFLLTPLFCALYYASKAVVIYIKTEKSYQNHLSDVKEIVKED